ncbi:hypothetical protein [Thiothrix fructosivorans]|uniref:Uncharacterized protein n=1 Tax=Thiothrix fructosivorans TaxID=111770 RepID=A0ABS3IJ14_9GAMM|nr:hypothetical protein [Thiothrix fructosivorans]MBO0613009.1 hypothetical protein [Thiothrix fructosivorans]
MPDLEAVRMDYKALGDFDVERLHLETLLFQTGYLTIFSGFGWYYSVMPEG